MWSNQLKWGSNKIRGKTKAYLFSIPPQNMYMASTIRASIAEQTMWDIKLICHNDAM